MKPVAFQGAYADLKFIKTRSVAAITVEIPIEHAAAFVEAFGAPTPGAEVPVAIARLQPEKAVSEPPPKPVDEHPKERRKFSDLPYSTQAAMRCNEEAFQRFLREIPEGNPHTWEEREAAEVVRRICGVQSRADLATDNEASCKWAALELKYRLWLREPEIV